jgi:hypothetical protein
MSSEQYKKTTSTTEPVLGSTKTTVVTPVQHPTTTYQTVHPTGLHQEPVRTHPTVDQTDTHGKKWSEEASMVGSDVREGLGKYKDVRPATGATGFEQATNVGPVHETGHTDASVYRAQDMTDTASKVGSDQREGLGTAAKETVEKDTKHHKHEHDKHHHKHEHDAATYGTTYSTTTATTGAYTTTKTADVIPVVSQTKHVYPEHKNLGTTGYTSYSTTGYQADTTGTPTHYKYDSTDKTPHYGSGMSRDEGTTFQSSGARANYGSPSRTGVHEETATKIGSDQREGLGTGAAYDTTHHTAGWSDTANKTGSDIREGLGSGSSK